MPCKSRVVAEVTAGHDLLKQLLEIVLAVDSVEVLVTLTGLSTVGLELAVV